MSNFKPSKPAVRTATTAAAGAAVGTIVTIAVVSAAFRVPKSLRQYLPDRKSK